MGFQGGWLLPYLKGVFGQFLSVFRPVFEWFWRHAGRLPSATALEAQSMSSSSLLKHSRQMSRTIYAGIIWEQ
jgi:hypothetical protein